MYYAAVPKTKSCLGLLIRQSQCLPIFGTWWVFILAPAHKWFWSQAILIGVIFKDKAACSCLTGYVFASVILKSRLKSQGMPIALYCCFVFSIPSKDTFLLLRNVRNFPQLVWLCFPLFKSSTSHLVFARKTSVLRKTCGKHVRVCLLLNIVKLPPWQLVTTMWLVLKFIYAPKQNRLTF